MNKGYNLPLEEGQRRKIHEAVENLDSLAEMLTMDSEYTSSGYTIVKLPYGNDIYLLYGVEAYHAALSPAFDLKYAGFYKRKCEQAYNIREPLNRSFGFEGNPISEASLKSMLIEAIQKTVADYIAVHAEEFSGIPITTFDDDIAGDAEKAFSKKEAHLDFHKKITVSDWSISDRDMVQFVDDPDSLLKRKAEERMRSHEEELARLWVAHCASQKILDQLFAETTEDGHNEQSEKR